jgi:hypothetical protein
MPSLRTVDSKEFMTTKTMKWETSLSQNAEKERSDLPDFIGEAVLGSSTYDCAAWLGEIGRGTNIGRPYIGLQLTSTGTASSQKVNVSLWEKRNRATEAEPHFTTRELVNGQTLKFSAWVEAAGSLHALRVMIEPFVPNDSELSDAARVTQKKLAAFMKQARARLPDKGQQPELPIAKDTEEKESDTALEPDTEPDGIPF